jgi:hypothetical protein
VRGKRERDRIRSEPAQGKLNDSSTIHAGERTGNEGRFGLSSDFSGSQNIMKINYFSGPSSGPK